MTVLALQNVTTSLGKKQVIRKITFEIKRGKVLALLGHNGAGKSTLIKTVMGILEKDEGKITLLNSYDQDEDFLSFKHYISYIPEEPFLLAELTVMQHFQLYGKSYKIPEEELEEKIRQYTKGFDLVDKLDAYADSLSKGMRQKVQMISALLPDVPLLLIDEPFIGLDIFAIDYLKTLLQEKVINGTSILLTTHQFDHLKGIADEFLILQEGEMQEKGSIEQFDTISRGERS